MSDLPRRWEWTTIGEVSATSLGKMLDKKQATGMHPTQYLRNINVRWGSFDLPDLAEMDIRPDELDRVLAQPGDAEVVALCRRFGVLRLEVFGSATGSEFDPARSDLDFLVELDPPEGTSRFEAFFGLKEALEVLLGCPVDLVDPSALDNPYFAEMVEQTRRELYAE